MTDTEKAAPPAAPEAETTVPPAVESVEGSKPQGQEPAAEKADAKDSNGGDIASEPASADQQQKEHVEEQAPAAAEQPKAGKPAPKESAGNEDSDNYDGDDLKDPNSKKRGRPPGSKNGSKRVATHASAPPDNQGPPPAQPGKRQRARPKRFDDYLSTEDIPDPEPEKDREAAAVKPAPAPVAAPAPKQHTNVQHPAAAAMGAYAHTNTQYPPTVAPAAAQYAAGPAAAYSNYAAAMAGYGGQLPTGYAPAFQGYGGGLGYDAQGVVIRPSNNSNMPPALPLQGANPALQLLLLNQQQLFKQ